MQKKEISVNPSFLKLQVDRGVCPLNWLAKFYKDYDEYYLIIKNMKGNVV